MRSFAFATILAAANAAESQLHLDFANHCAKFGFMHNNLEDFKMRMGRFAEVDEFIKKNNSSDATHVAGHNQFSTWTHEEYKAILGHIKDENRAEATKFDES